MVSSYGIKVDLKKIEAVQSWPRPSTAADIWSFLGLSGYYHHFVEGFSSIKAPLSMLTQKGLTSANVVADALNRKTESTESLASIPTLERPFTMDFQSLDNRFEPMLRGGAKEVAIRHDGVLRLYDQSCVPNVDGLRELSL
ncbi:PREDICTED: uncharacterized protein LOC109237299 [Nicotiana attenuata]|uniref:uncharacterized protein LOC109237299 n=1 Tax=Nicotiana attenuata TaxID=49451 RepID=UPI0009059C5D|nr:PREDICTED: uncharacterized protein LOC109237299 [Nicotiana attenuata]